MISDAYAPRLYITGLLDRRNFNKIIFTFLKSVFLKRRPLASIILGRERPEETTIYYKISLVQLITNLNIILYLSTCHTVYKRVLILFMIMT